MKPTALKKGDYILASKYSDGHLDGFIEACLGIPWQAT